MRGAKVRQCRLPEQKMFNRKSLHDTGFQLLVQRIPGKLFIENCREPQHIKDAAGKTMFAI